MSLSAHAFFPFFFRAFFLSFWKGLMLFSFFRWSVISPPPAFFLGGRSGRILVTWDKHSPLRSLPRCFFSYSLFFSLFSLPPIICSYSFSLFFCFPGTFLGKTDAVFCPTLSVFLFSLPSLFSRGTFFLNRTFCGTEPFPPPVFFPFSPLRLWFFFFASPGLFSGNEDRFLPYSSPPPPPFSSAFPFFPGTFFPTRTLFFSFPFYSLSPPSPPFSRDLFSDQNPFFSLSLLFSLPPLPPFFPLLRLQLSLIYLGFFPFPLITSNNSNRWTLYTGK